MDTYEQIRALTAVIANLPETGAWTERDVMEILLDVFEPQELVELGYDDRLNAYMKEYGNADTCATLPRVGRCWDDAYSLPQRKAALHGATVRVLCDVQFRLKYRLMFGTFIFPKGVDLSRKMR